MKKPTKRQVFDAILGRCPTLFMHIDATAKGVDLPPSRRGKTEIVLQVGMNMPVPITAMSTTEYSFEGTLSFAGIPYHCTIPWDAVYALVGDDNKGIVYDQDMPNKVHTAMLAQAEQSEVAQARIKAEDAHRKMIAAFAEEPPARSNVISFAAARERLRGKKKGSPFKPAG